MGMQRVLLVSLSLCLLSVLFCGCLRCAGGSEQANGTRCRSLDRFLGERLEGAGSNRLLVSYADPNVMQYARYSSRLQRVFAAVHNFSYLLLTLDDVLLLHEESRAEGFADSPCEHDKHPTHQAQMDPRWIKVYIMSLVLSLSRFAHVSHAVWMDIDMIPLTLSYDVFSLWPKSSQLSPELIISSELHAETGVANTGMFLVRRSERARRLLRLWWCNVSHSIGHDQIGFDFLYKHLLRPLHSIEPDCSRCEAISLHREQVVLLPSNALNSLPPAYLHQRPSDPLLHLMGEHNRYRETVFGAALAALCDRFEEYSLSHSLPMAFSHQYLYSFVQWMECLEPQLGVNRETLRTQMLNHIRQSSSRSLEIVQQAIAYESLQYRLSDEQVADWLRVVSEMREMFLLQQKILREHSSLFHEKEDCARLTALSTALALLRALLRRCQPSTSVVDAAAAAVGSCSSTACAWGQCSAQQRVDLLSHSSLLSHDMIQALLHWTKNSSTMTSASLDATNLTDCPRQWLTGTWRSAEISQQLAVLDDELQELLHSVEYSQRHLISEMQSSFLQSRAEHCLSTNSEDVSCIEHLRRSLNVLLDIDESNRNPFRLRDGYSSAAHALCAHPVHSDRGLRHSAEGTVAAIAHYFDQAILLSFDLLSKEKHVKDDHYQLIGTLAEAMECLKPQMIGSPDSRRQLRDWLSLLAETLSQVQLDKPFQKYVRNVLCADAFQEIVSAHEQEFDSLRLGEVLRECMQLQVPESFPTRKTIKMRRKRKMEKMGLKR